jgi:hypothetical protein
MTVKGLLYIQKNRNLVFYPKYLKEMERLDFRILKKLQDYLIKGELKDDTIFFYLQKQVGLFKMFIEKDELMIYENIYLFDSYFYSMLVATLGIVFQSLIRFLIPIVRRFLGLSSDKKKKTEEDDKQSIVSQIVNFVLEIE